jgi:prepilin-type N-terminal cleavage/methylation domain-containing protein
MKQILRSARGRRLREAFSLVEILVVMAIIGILLGIITFAGFGVMKQAAISRANTEISAMKSALQSYISDNGAPPPDTTLNGPPSGNYPSPATPADQAYIKASHDLYTNLSGKTSYTATTLSTKSYMTFNLSQVGSPNVTGTYGTYAQDPFGYSYGYSTGGTSTNQYPYAGPGFFDIWSTGGPSTTGTANTTNSWITSWSN